MPPFLASHNLLHRMAPVAFTSLGQKHRRLEVTMFGSLAKRPRWILFTQFTGILSRTGLTLIILLQHIVMHTIK
ncbi:hypothetical protein L208DRAFT_1529408 [Tricholoma matsutake]|nr:hypothetical protein L208DRAFT_1529408 [Tricholoma matsutake 945]